MQKLNTYQDWDQERAVVEGELFEREQASIGDFVLRSLADILNGDVAERDFEEVDSRFYDEEYY